MNTLEPFKAIGVVRVSTEKQAQQNGSRNEQKEVISKYASKNNYLIDEWVELEESASDMRLPIRKAIALCIEKDIKVVIAKNISRITRGGWEALDYFIKECHKYGVKLIDTTGIISYEEKSLMEDEEISFKMSTYNPSKQDAMREAEFAEKAKRELVSNMINSQIRYAKMGYWVNNTNYGYQVERRDCEEGRRCFLIPHPTESPHIIKLFELQATSGKSDQEIVDILNNDGYRSRVRNKRATGNKRQIIGKTGGNKLDVKQMFKILQNPIYCGVADSTWGDNLKKRIVKRFYGTHLVSIELFNKANKGKVTIFEDTENNKIYITTGNRKPWLLFKKYDNPNFPYKHVILCPRCHHTLTGSTSRGRHGDLSSLYHCSHKTIKVEDKQYSIRKDDLHKTINDFVNKIKLSDSFIERLREAYLRKFEQRRQDALTGSISIDSKIQKIKDAQAEIVEKIKKVTHPTVIQSMESDLNKLDEDLVELKKHRNNQEEDQTFNQDAINKFWFYLEHFDKLILGGGHTLQSASLFGLLFDEYPTPQELIVGTPKIASIFALKLSQKSDSEA